MAEGREAAHKPSEVIGALLREVVKLPDMLFVMGKGPSGVMEGWVDSEGTQVTVQDDWAAVESKPWHCHLHLTEVAEIRFVEEPDVHDSKRQSFSIRFLGRDGEPLLMIFFGRMYDDGGVLISDKVARFHTLQEKYRLG
jgi:putative heme iron utilization protein